MRYVFTLMLLLLLVAGAPVATQAQETSAPPPAGKAVGTVVNLNTATAEQIATLPGIGLKTAQRIIEHRQKNGPFKKPEELMNVKGIGEKSFLKLKPLVTVTAPKPENATK
jgi:competence protein ComEA